MTQIKEIMRIAVTVVVEQLLKFLWLFPIKQNSVMFISYSGNYSDSPKYIYKEMKRAKPAFEYIWATNDSSEKEVEIEECKKVRFGSFAYYKSICTSRIIIVNNFLNTFIPRRAGQRIINTWHGGSPLKTVGMVGNKISTFDHFFYKEHGRKYSCFLSSSQFMTEEVFKKSFGYKGKIFNCGLPRNAVLFREDEYAKRKVSEWFNIPIDDSNGIILYAPTFRGSAKNAGFIPKEQQFCIDDCILAMQERFGKNYRFLFRSHYFEDSVPTDCCIASDYPDMQELLLAADVLITDYSSCMGDMCLMKKPTFLYTPDLEEYIKDSGFYWDINTLPFPVAKTPDELFRSIREFDESKYRAGIEVYLKMLGSYEGPDSDQKATEFINSMMSKG